MTYDPKFSVKQMYDQYGRSRNTTKTAGPKGFTKKNTSKPSKSVSLGGFEPDPAQRSSRGLGSKPTFNFGTDDSSGSDNNPNKDAYESKSAVAKLYDRVVTTLRNFGADDPEDVIVDGKRVYQGPLFRGFDPTTSIGDFGGEYGKKQYLFGMPSLGEVTPRSPTPPTLPPAVDNPTLNMFGVQRSFARDPDPLLPPDTMEQNIPPMGSPAYSDAAVKSGVDDILLNLAEDYVIEAGDTLSEIAEDRGTTVEVLQKLNNISDAEKDMIFTGDKLKVPPKQTDTIRISTRGDENITTSLIPRIRPNSSELPEGEYYTPYDMSDLEILARTIEAEAGGESKKGKLAVGSTIKNRVDKQSWMGKDIKDVILKPGQYSPWNSYTSYAGGEQGQAMLTAAKKPSKDSYEAAKKILSGDYKDPTGGATHFVNPKVGTKPSWYNKLKEYGIKKIGQHEFGSPDDPFWSGSLKPKIRPKGLGAK